MQINLNELHTSNEILTIVRKNKVWYIITNNTYKKIDYHNLSTLMQIGKKFISVNSTTILNSDYITHYGIHEGSFCVFMNEERYPVLKQHQKRIKAACQSIILQRYIMAPIDAREKILDSKKIIHQDLVISSIDLSSTIFLFRDGIKTFLWREDGTQKVVYSTLKYFENFIPSNSSLIRIRRNCIINLKYITKVDLNIVQKTGKVQIGEHSFVISRRMFYGFKRLLTTLGQP